MSSLSVQKRVAIAFFQSQNSYLSVDDVFKAISQFVPDVKKRTVQKSFERLARRGWIEPITDGTRRTVFKCARPDMLSAYVEGRHECYAGQMPPQIPKRPIGSVRHRPGYPIRLFGVEAQKFKQIAEYKKFGRAPAYYEIRTGSFYMKMWSSGKANVFINGPWLEDMSHLLGDSVVAKVKEQVYSRNGHIGVARPDLPQGATPSEMPIGHVFRVDEPDGSTTVFQYGHSQIDAGELDRHGKENAPNGNRVEGWLYEETKFKADVSNKFNAIDMQLDHIGRKMDEIPEKVGQAVREALEPIFKPETTPYAPVDAKTRRGGDDPAYI